MKSKLIVLLAVLVGLSALNGALSPAAAQTEGVKQARLGPYAPAKQDWAAIEAAARNEGKVVIYSVSSRIFKLQKEFKEKFGVEIVGYDIASGDQIQKFGREYQAGAHQVDVLFNNSTPDLLAKFVPKKMIWNFVPDTAAPFLDDNEKEPFLVQRWSSRVLIYNTAFNPGGPPIDNLWDLTRKEWKGRVLTPDPMSGVMGAVYQTILQHPDKMAAAYQKEFGKPISISPGMKDAGQEWMMRFMKNDPVTLASTSKIFKGIAKAKQKKTPPIGFTTFSRLRKLKKGKYEAAAFFNMEPVFGVAYPTVFVIADQAPHPNAAKLLIRYMVGEGIWPWNVLGDYAARSDIEANQVKKYNIPSYDKVKLWAIDPANIYKTKVDYVNFYMSIAQ
jgi:iron(III) transport system substrate-binding protein